MPTAKTYTVLVEWIDGEVCGADEIVVLGNSKSEANAKARHLWWKTKGAEWPLCRIRKVRTIRERDRWLIPES